MASAGLPGERTVAGLRCGEVLARLSDYLDGRLDVAARQAVEAHVKGCSVCERFGGTFGRTITALREELKAATGEDDVEALLRRASDAIEER